MDGFEGERELNFYAQKHVNQYQEVKRQGGIEYDVQHFRLVKKGEQ